jgi:hypothetical protein
VKSAGVEGGEDGAVGGYHREKFKTIRQCFYPLGVSLTYSQTPVDKSFDMELGVGLTQCDQTRERNGNDAVVWKCSGRGKRRSKLDIGLTYRLIRSPSRRFGRLLASRTFIVSKCLLFYTRRSRLPGLSSTSKSPDQENILIFSVSGLFRCEVVAGS